MNTIGRSCPKNLVLRRLKVGATIATVARAVFVCLALWRPGARFMYEVRTDRDEGREKYHGCQQED